MSQQYKQTLTYLYKQLPMYQRVGSAAFKKDLTNIIALCTYLGEPQKRFPSIHLAGTNGKGSTSHLLAAMLQASGQRVGMYTSPHYKDFRERIKINGQLITQQYIIDFVAAHKEVFEKIRPSFFEITVALAFDYFAAQEVDVAIIETGLGGRLDSTNIIRPLLSIITNIGYDHQQFLGTTLPEIAFEKAGIIKENIPVIIGETQEETRGVFEKKAKEVQVSICFADQEITLTKEQESDFHISYSIQTTNTNNDLPASICVNLKGDYQEKNIVTALQAISQLQKQERFSTITKEAIEKGLFNLKEYTYFIGRWQQLGINPLILCDSAHNVDGLKIVWEQVKQLSYKELHIVFGMVNDKDRGKILSLFPTEAQYYFAKANIPRGLDAAILKKEAAEYGLKGRAYVSVKNALKAAKRKAKREDLIFIGGSIFIVAEVL